MANYNMTYNLTNCTLVELKISAGQIPVDDINVLEDGVAYMAIFAVDSYYGWSGSDQLSNIIPNAYDGGLDYSNPPLNMNKDNNISLYFQCHDDSTVVLSANPRHPYSFGLNNCTIVGETPIAWVGPTTISFLPDDGYEFKYAESVQGPEGSYGNKDLDTGIVTLTIGGVYEPGSVYIVATATLIPFDIAVQFENVTADVTNPIDIAVPIEFETTADLKFTLKEDFPFNAFKIEVTGADHAVMVAGKELTLELANPTANVSIKVTGYIASTNNDYYEVVDGVLYLVYNGRNRMRYNKRWIRKNQVGGN